MSEFRIQSSIRQLPPEFIEFTEQLKKNISSTFSGQVKVSAIENEDKLNFIEETLMSSSFKESNTGRTIGLEITIMGKTPSDAKQTEEMIQNYYNKIFQQTDSSFSSTSTKGNTITCHIQLT